MESGGEGKSFCTILECPICFEISRPPIYACEIGHLICKDCVRKVDACPICRSKYTGTRNFTAEELWVRLNNKETSPNAFETSSDTRLHKLEKYSPEDSLANADPHFPEEDPNEFRPVKCCLSADQCQNSKVDFFSYLDHLRTVHNVFSCSSNTHSKRQHIKGNQLVRNGSSKVFIMNCFERQFLISMHQENRFVHIWAALHGSREESERYKSTLSIKHKDFEDLIWTGPVHCIRETQEQILISGAFLKISVDELKKRLVKFSWLIHAQITEVVIPPVPTLQPQRPSRPPPQPPRPTTSTSTFVSPAPFVSSQSFLPPAVPVPRSSLCRPPVPRPPRPAARSQSFCQIRQSVTAPTTSPPLPPGTVRVSMGANSRGAAQMSQLNRQRMENLLQRQPHRSSFSAPRSRYIAGDHDEELMSVLHALRSRDIAGNRSAGSIATSTSSTSISSDLSGRMNYCNDLPIIRTPTPRKTRDCVIL